MTTLRGFRSEYVAALHRHMADRGETTLRDGYELGRRALAERVSALDLAAIHHDALASSLDGTRRERMPEIIAAAAAFFQEILSAFEMVHRGYREAAVNAAAERRQAAMLRRLSSFLTDASLSARQTDSVTEVLQLVAEHARELTSASYSSASWGAPVDEQVRVTASDPEAVETIDPRVIEYLERVAPALPSRVPRSRWADEPALSSIKGVYNALTVPITALDGRPSGLLQLVEKTAGDFTDADEAVVVHLADMTAAALERAELYRRHLRI
jgi:GAF domain-containing protein